MKKNNQQIFQNVIGISIKKLVDYLSAKNKEEFQIVNEKLKKNDKIIKELDANKYFFIFESLCQLPTVQPIQQTLKSIQILISQNFLIPIKTPEILQSFVNLLRKYLDRYPEQISNILILIDSPKFKFIELIFEAYPLCLYQSTSNKIKTKGLSILSKIYSFRLKQYDEFTLKLYRYYKPLHPTIQDYELVTEIQQQKRLKFYINKILLEMVDKVEDDLIPQNKTKDKGKFGRCFICRIPAQFYCKDTKVPICSAQCKKFHLQQIASLSSLTVFYNEDQKNQIEKYLFELVFKNIHPGVKLLALEYIVQIILSSKYNIHVPFQLFTDQISYIGEIKRLYFYFVCLYFKEKNLFCEHIFFDLLLYCENNDEYKIHSEYYFKELFSNERMFQIYYNFDLQEDRPNLVKNILQVSSKLNKQLSKTLIQNLINLIFNNPTKQNQTITLQKKEKQNSFVNLFNNNVDKGLEALKKCYNNKQIAHFIKKNEKSLSRERIGQLFSKNSDQIKDILSYFIKILNINQLEVDEALREIFYHFSVLQSQQIYRIIQVFTKNYSNPKFKDQDELFQFSYFILILQTELHNPSIQKRMTFDEMIKRIASFNVRISEDKQYLKNVYKNIRGKPFSQTQKKIKYNNFEQLEIRELKNYNKNGILIDNWSLIYSILSIQINSNNIKLIYRFITILIEHQISQIFLYLLIKQFNQIDLINKQLLQDQVFVISSVINILWHNPNFVDKEWKKIFMMFQQFQKLSQKVNIQNKSFQSKNHQRIKPFLSQNQITRLFQTTPKLKDDQLVRFCQGMLQVNSKKFLSQVVKLLMINLERINIFWEYVCLYISQQENYLLKIQSFSEIIILLSKHIYGNAKNNQFEPYLIQAIQKLTFEKSNQEIFIDTIVDMIKQCKKVIPLLIWQTILKTLSHLSLENKISICKILKIHECPLYQQYIINQLVITQSLQFFKANSEVIYDNPEKIQPFILKIKNKELIKKFIVPIFCGFIIKNIRYFQSSVEIFNLLKQNIQKINQQNIQEIIKFINQNIKNLETQGISLLILFLKKFNKTQKIFDTLIKSIENNEIQFPEYEDKKFTPRSQYKILQFPHFQLNYLAVVKKSAIQLSIIKDLTEIYEILDLQILQKISQIIDKLLLSSRKFNRNIVLRYLLWKDGLLKELKQLPGLLKKQRNCETLKIHVLKRLVVQKVYDFNNFVKYVNGLFNDLINRYNQYIEGYQYYKSSKKQDLNYYYFNEIQREISDYKKILWIAIQFMSRQMWTNVNKQLKKEVIITLSNLLCSGFFKFTENKLNLLTTKQQLNIKQIIQNILKQI